MSANPESYFTIQETATSEFKDRGSKFIAFTYPIEHADEVKGHIKLLKELHPKAIHFCYAYRLGIDKNAFRANDDGEPSGSAGKPILSQIDSLKITNVLVVVIRYWGGTLLGVPGLINAYKTAAADALKQCEIVEKDLELEYELTFNYTILNEVMRIIKQYHARVIRSEATLFCEYVIRIPLKSLNPCLASFGNLYELTVKQATV